MSISGCATNAGGYTNKEAVNKRLVGINKEEVATKLGAPTDSIKISENIEVWTYRTGSAGITGGQCIISLTIKNGVVISSNINKTDFSPLAAPLGSCSSIIGNLD